MLHEHILRGTRAPGGGRATPAPLLFLDSGHALQPRRLLSSLTQKCFISLPDPHARTRGRPVTFSCASLLWCGWDGEEEGTQCIGLKSGFWGPPKIRQTTPLSCCGL